MKRLLIILLSLMAAWPIHISAQGGVPLKGLGRFDGWRENALVGYGLVTGLAGTGDTRQNAVTRQALSNVLARLGTTVSEDDISSRNVAVVMVTATLPASANIGDRVNVTVSSIGDARSLAGGTLLMTPLLGPDRRPYALAQGPLVTGGHAFQAEFELRQRNFPTTALIEGGATIEAPVEARILHGDGLRFLLNQPSFTTAQRIADAVNMQFGARIAVARGADAVHIDYSGRTDELTSFVSFVENVGVLPDQSPRIVINERTGTVVAGGDVVLSSVVIAQGDLEIRVDSERFASQPTFISGFANDISSLVITNVDLEVGQSRDVVASFPSTTVADLVNGLASADVDTRRMISILQAIKAAGALHAEIIVQ